MDDNNKRRRRTADSAVLHITDLPDGLLVSIANYLAKPSTVLFAIAMTIDSEQQTETSKAIISSTNWKVLDFGDIEKCLAAKLLDEDIDNILRSIDAVNNLHILKLAGCVNITGSGLDKLRSSVAIEQIDLSLVGKHEVPLGTESLLSEDLVIPILRDIIGSVGTSSLKQLEFPKMWRNTRTFQFGRFLERYNRYMSNKRICCSKCNLLWGGRGYVKWMNTQGDEWYGTQNFTCSGCLIHFWAHTLFGV